MDRIWFGATFICALVIAAIITSLIILTQKLVISNTANIIIIAISPFIITTFYIFLGAFIIVFMSDLLFKWFKLGEIEK